MVNCEKAANITKIYRVLIIIISLTLLVVSSITNAQVSEQQVRAKYKQLKQLIREKGQANEDVSEADKLSRKGKEAYKQGDFSKADSLFDEAFALLSAKTIRKGEKVIKPEVSKRKEKKGQRKSTARGTATGSPKDKISSIPVAVKEKEVHNDFPSVIADKKGDLYVTYLSFKEAERGERILLRKFEGKEWGEEIEISDIPGEYFSPKMAIDKRGRIWVVWSGYIEGQWDLYAKYLVKGKWSGIIRLTNNPGPDIFHQLISDATGKLWLCWQSFRKGNFDIYLKFLTDKSWSEDIQITTHPANDWQPSITCDSKGRIYIAWDSYRNGDYDIYMKSYFKGKLSEPIPVACSAYFEARVNIVCDKKDRVWMAWESGSPNWGKDFGLYMFRNSKGSRNGGIYFGPERKKLEDCPHPLHGFRKIEIVCFDNGKFYKPVKELPQEFTTKKRDNGYRRDTPGPTNFYERPYLVFDKQGNLRLFYRYNGSGYYTHRTLPGRDNYWEIHTISYSGNKWSKPTVLESSHGRNDQEISTCFDKKGNLWITWARGNVLTDPPTVYGVFLTVLKKDKTEKGEPALVPTEVPKPGAGKFIPKSKPFTIEVRGKKYQLFWGDMHRHTDFSACARSTDGCLVDAYRYAIDVAQLDFLNITDHLEHQCRHTEGYHWYLNVEYADMFNLPGVFLTYYGFEYFTRQRGHRNVILLSKEDIPDIGQKKDEGKTLWDYLRGLNAITIPHHPMSLEYWDYRDPVFEPIVEIYQGCRRSFELPNGVDSGNPNWNQGSIWLGLRKGQKFGFVASSDHASTHISFAGVYAPEFSKKAIFEAMQKRFTLASTDKIFIDFRIENSRMGEELETDIPPALKIKVIGTDEIEKVEIIENASFVYTMKPHKKEVEFIWKDPEPTKGESYYYVRVTQSDEERAWSSPIWVKYK